MSMAAIAVTTRQGPKQCLSSNRAIRTLISHRPPKQVLYLPDTCESDLRLSEPYHTVKNVKEFGIRTITHGFQRRPELIRQRQPQFDSADSLQLKFSSAAFDSAADEIVCTQRGPRLVNNLSYGLYEKCERIQEELTSTTLQLMGLKHFAPKHCPLKHVERTDKHVERAQENRLTLLGSHRPPRNCAEGGVSLKGLKDGCKKTELVLDIGCGYGFSLNKLCRNGVCVVGVDMDLRALSVLQHKTHTGYLPSDSAHVVQADVAHGLCFRDSAFDWAISVSFLQWLCAAENPLSVLRVFFQSLSFVLKSRACVGIQFYPKNAEDVQKVLAEAAKYFNGALVSDYPHVDRGRKLFLVLINKK